MMSQHWFGKFKIALQYAIYQSGPMSMAPSQLGAFTRSDQTQATPNLQYHVQPLSLDKFGDALHDFPAFTASVCNLRPTSRGSVHLTSSEHEIAPCIMPNYLSTDADKQVAIDAIHVTRRIVSAPAFQRFQPEEWKPGLQYQSRAQLLDAAGMIGTTIFHPVGSCKMGAGNDALAVVDSRLRVRGMTGLRIADASIMPNITSGNTNAPTIMIAEKAALMIAEDWKMAQI